VKNPDPGLYREASVSLGLHDETYRGFLSRGRIAGRVRLLLGGREWDFRKPYLPRGETDHFRQDLVAMGLEARWEEEALVISDPQQRWRPTRIGPNRHGLYPVGAFGRAVQVGSGYHRDWEEVAPLPEDAPLDADALATALDTGLSLGPGFDRIEREVGVYTLIDALLRCRTDHARERLCVLVAHHAQVVEAVEALPHIVRFLEGNDATTRGGAAHSIATIVGRAGRRRARAAMPGLSTALHDRLAREEDDRVRQELETALDVMGDAPPTDRDDDAEWFVREATSFLDFLRAMYGLEAPAIEHRRFSTTVSYRNETTAVVATADWRDGVADVLLAKLIDGGLPLSLDGMTNSLPPSVVAHGAETAREAAMADPGDRDGTLALLEREARALHRCDDVLRGDFTRFDLAVAREKQ
jgi:hypothetical protein